MSKLERAVECDRTEHCLSANQFLLLLVVIVVRSMYQKQGRYLLCTGGRHAFMGVVMYSNYRDTYEIH